MDLIRNGEVKYFHPFVNLADHESVVKSLAKSFSSYDDITVDDIKKLLSTAIKSLLISKRLQDKADEP